MISLAGAIPLQFAPVGILSLDNFFEGDKMIKTKECQMDWHGNLICKKMLDATAMTMGLSGNACDECDEESFKKKMKKVLEIKEKKQLFHIPTPNQKYQSSLIDVKQLPSIPSFLKVFGGQNFDIKIKQNKKKYTHSYIIHSYNRKEYIPAIYEHSKKTNPVELIIIEDGSTDGSKELWKEIEAKDSKVKVYDLNNWHEVHSYNFGISKSKGDLAIILQSDMAPPSSPIWMNDVNTLFSSFPNLSVLGGYNNIVIESTDGKIKRHDFNKNHIKLFAPKINGIPFCFTPATIVGVYIVKKSDFIKFGGFKEIHPKGNFSIFHDVIYSHKVWKNGKSVGAFAPDFITFSRAQIEAKDDAELKRKYSTASNIDMEYIKEYQEDLASINIQATKENIKLVKRPIEKVNIFDKIKGIKLAFGRVKEYYKTKDTKSLWVDENELVERQVCCSMCTDGVSCPYCGCRINKSWFLPLGKSELTTEGCPNPETYPHLKNFPAKNYWKVCQQKSSIVFFYKNDDISELSAILDKIRKNATGSIEVIVGIKSDLYISMNHLADVIIVKGAVDIEELKEKATGDYIFLLDECDYEDFGYDTKLKYEHVK